MKTVTEFNKQTLNEIRIELDKVLTEFGDKHNLKFVIPNIGYTANEFHTKLTCSLKVKPDGKTFDPELENFDKYHKMYGLQKSDLGKTFEMKGRSFKITGLNPKRRTCPLVIKDLGNNKSYQTEVDSYLLRIGRSKTSATIIGE